MPASRVLLVDADELSSELLAGDLEDLGYEVETCAELERVAELLAERAWDAIVSDRDTADLGELAALCEPEHAPALILLSAFGSLDEAVEAVRAGAADFLAKPVSSDQLRVALERTLERRELLEENERLRADLGERYELGRLVSRSPEMRRVFETARAVADTRATVLIQGESGTGKTLLARSLHRHSQRADAPFVEVNCGALPDSLLESELFGHVRGAFTGAVKDRAGKFEAADGGTLFLDEVACASLELQVKLLRVLQDRVFERVGDTRTLEVDVRVVAASNRPLAEEVAAGRFREDLFYRLNVLELFVPPLRERPGDVLLLAERFLERFAAEYGREARRLSPEVAAILTRHAWPGNVRELENCVERAVLLARGPEVGVEALPAALLAGAPPVGLPDLAPAVAPRTLREAVEATEHALILRTLVQEGGSRKRTAELLGVNRTTLFNKMRKYNLMDFAPSADEDSRT
ncbi:MAG: sigma-54-dependent Fis family transcriptional regulator [Planctomycetes bacterium]|nr:sigma-54-dependent Fis family transcriptional regulator [Planctomycetota bacterium]